MSVAIQVAPGMVLMNEQEMREVRAVQNYPKRALTELEQAIKDLTIVLDAERYAGLGDVIAVGDRMLSMNPNEVVDRICAATSMFTVRELAREAIHRPLALKRLVSMYPYVEYGHVINGNGLNVFQTMHLRGVSLERIREAALWLFNLQTSVLEIPEVGNKHWYIGTPGTQYHVMRSAISEQPEAAGLALPPSLQEDFNKLFRDNGKYNHPLQLIREYNLHKCRNFLSRFGFERPTRVDAVIEKVARGEIHIDDRRIGMGSVPTLTVTLAEFPAIGIEQVAIYHFVL